ncbi:porin family protein [Flavobacterium sp. UBA6135]|uniref:porin family protein n=1 Tax=Flavobacterium sp. UBA6135 TaxID=1946553 RepID=UPI0025B99D6C|nr:porin family protein [Flavobacterium sp. UBA6135]
MKKFMICFMALFVFGWTQAQEQEPVFGFKSGANFSNFSGDADADMRTGYYFGFLADFSISEKFHLQPEVLYSIEGGDGDVDLGINYIKVPVMAKYYVAEGFSLQAGPYLSVLTSTVESDFKDALKTLDYGLGFGLGYEFKNGLLIDGRFNLGLANIYDGEGAASVQNTAIQVGLGYRFF